MGPSGSGKSTLLTLAGGLDQPTAGTVSVEGVDLGDARQQGPRPDAAYVDRLRLPGLQPDPRADRRRERRPAARARRRARRAPPARAAVAALEEVGIGDLADRFPDEMSGGQQQRVAIARAIVGDRRLILADEPTGALDTDTGEEILRLLRARCDAGAAGVLVTHEARHAAWADRVVFLRDGIVVDESGRRPGRAPPRARDQPGEPPRLGWRPSLRMARRDALRARGRSILVLVMIALPVLAVTAADVVIQTRHVSGAEALDRRLGHGRRPGERSSRTRAACTRRSTRTAAAWPRSAARTRRRPRRRDDRRGRPGPRA